MLKLQQSILAYFFSMINLMTLITHESYAILQHVMLFKLLFSEIANFVPADTFNKIILNASKEEEEAKNVLQIGKRKKIKSNENYRNKIKAQKKEQRIAMKEAKIKAQNDGQVDEEKEKLDQPEDSDDSKKERREDS